MSVHAARPYRRGVRPSLQVPVVLPQVEVNVDEHGRLAVRVDHEPHQSPRALRREDLRRVVGDIAAGLGSAVRVEVREADGTAFTDIITPPPTPSAETATDPTPTVEGELCRSGFGPNELVAVAVIIARQTADADGVARLRLPPALLAAHRGQIILLSDSPVSSEGVA